MQVLACDGTWTVFSDGTSKCSGELHSIQADQLGNQPLTAEDRQQLYESTIVLFAIVFGFVVVRRLLR